MKCKFCNKNARYKTPFFLCNTHYQRWYRNGNFDTSWGKPRFNKTSGYFRITVDGTCKRGKRMQYHRYIMEQHIGRPLTNQEQVHHINGDKTNNSINNLKIITAKEHVVLYDAGRKPNVDWSKYIIPNNNKIKVCIIEGCDRPSRTKSLCSKHYLSYWGCKTRGKSIK